MKIRRGRKKKKEKQKRWEDFWRWNLLCMTAKKFSQHFDEEGFEIPHGNVFLREYHAGIFYRLLFLFFKVTLTYTYSNKLPVLYELTHYVSITSAKAGVGADYAIKNTERVSAEACQKSSELFLVILMAPIDLHVVSLCSERDCKFSAKGTGTQHGQNVRKITYSTP